MLLRRYMFVVLQILLGVVLLPSDVVERCFDIARVVVEGSCSRFVMLLSCRLCHVLFCAKKEVFILVASFSFLVKRVSFPLVVLLSV